MVKRMVLEISDSLSSLFLTNENGHATHMIKVNGVSMTIFQHDSGQVRMMVHPDKKSNFRVEICDAIVTKKTVWCGETRWADIQVVENLEMMNNE